MKIFHNQFGKQNSSFLKKAAEKFQSVENSIIFAVRNFSRY